MFIRQCHRSRRCDIRRSAFYAKGGYAWADDRFSIAGLGGSFSESKVLSGWTVGAGVEYMFAPNWSLKGEYMYADYGGERYLTAFASGGLELGATTHTVKGGINYHFNWGGSNFKVRTLNSAGRGPAKAGPIPCLRIISANVGKALPGFGQRLVSVRPRPPPRC